MNTFDELTKIMMDIEVNPSFLGNICTFQVTNLVPAQYRVKITGIVTEFDYRDGTQYRDTDDPISVGYGQIARTESNDATKCVKTTFTVIRVQQEGFPPTVLQHQYDVPNPNECAINISVDLTLNESILLVDLGESITKSLTLK